MLSTASPSVLLHLHQCRLIAHFCHHLQTTTLPLAGSLAIASGSPLPRKRHSAAPFASRSLLHLAAAPVFASPFTAQSAPLRPVLTHQLSSRRPEKSHLTDAATKVARAIKDFISRQIFMKFVFVVKKKSVW
jgi:hypothetical protein